MLMSGDSWGNFLFMMKLIPLVWRWSCRLEMYSEYLCPSRVRLATRDHSNLRKISR